MLHIFFWNIILDIIVLKFKPINLFVLQLHKLILNNYYKILCGLYLKKIKI